LTIFAFDSSFFPLKSVTTLGGKDLALHFAGFIRFLVLFPFFLVCSCSLSLHCLAFWLGHFICIVFLFNVMGFPFVQKQKQKQIILNDD